MGQGGEWCCEMKGEDQGLWGCMMMMNAAWRRGGEVDFYQAQVFTTLDITNPLAASELAKVEEGYPIVRLSMSPKQSPGRTRRNAKCLRGIVLVLYGTCSRLPLQIPKKIK